MKQTKFHTISGTTSLVGVLGDPIGHSLSPVIHNAALAEMGLNWCYLAIPCKSNDLTLVTDALKRTNCKGLNVTIPHKIDAIKLCNKINQIAKEIGAVNTLIPDKNNNWVGENTDIKLSLIHI